MTTIYIFSTLSAAVNYHVFRGGAGELPQIEETITVAGGANIADKRIETPRGVVTKVTPEQLSALEQNQVFQLHVKNGYITVSESDSDPEQVAADMTTRDASAPLSEGDFAIDGEDAPSITVGGKKTGGKK